MQVAQSEQVIQGLSINALEEACRRETARWRREGASDTQFCLEIFRRALERSGSGFLDEPARTSLVAIYTDYIRANINRKATTNGLSEDLIQQVWLRFWQAATNGQLQFRSLEAALSYLRMATISTVIEAQKQAWRQAREVALVEATDNEDRPGSVPDDASLQLGSNDTPFDAVQRARFRARCREVIQDPLVYRIFWLRYSLGMAPRDIARQLADAGILIRDHTATPRAVSDVLEQQIARLAIDPEIRDLLQAD